MARRHSSARSSAPIFGPWTGTELYANAGTGFHSNDARGAAIRVDPVTGEPVDRVTPLVRAQGAEIGLRTVRIRGLQSTVALWYLGLDSELLFVGDAGTTEAGTPKPPRRPGMDQLRAARALADASTLIFAFTHARFSDDDPAGTQIPGALDRVISAGVTVEPRQPLFGSLRVRHFGPRPLIEDAQRHVQRARRSGMARSAIALSNKAASGARGVQHLRRGSLGHRLLLRVAPARRAWRACSMSTRIRRFRAPRGSGFRSRSNLASVDFLNHPVSVVGLAEAEVPLPRFDLLRAIADSRHVARGAVALVAPDALNV